MSQDLPEQWKQLAEQKGIRPTIRGIAEAAGITPSTMSRLLSTQARNSPGTVHAISEALGISETDVLRHAQVPSGALGPWAPPREAHLLTGRQRKALDDLIRAVVAERSAEGAGATIFPMALGNRDESLAQLRESIRLARADVADWEDRMPQTEGGRELLQELRQKVRDLELQEAALSERLNPESNETTL